MSVSENPFAAGSKPVVFFATWCPYCTKLLAGLEELGVEFDKVDVENDARAAEASAWVESVNDGNRIVPTVLYPDGSHATNPPAEEVARKVAAS